MGLIGAEESAFSDGAPSVDKVLDAQDANLAKMGTKPHQIVKIGRVDHATAGGGRRHHDRIDHRRTWHWGDRLACALGETLRHFLGGQKLQDLRLVTAAAPPFRDHGHGDGDPR